MPPLPTTESLSAATFPDDVFERPKRREDEAFSIRIRWMFSWISASCTKLSSAIGKYNNKSDALMWLRLIIIHNCMFMLREGAESLPRMWFVFDACDDVRWIDGMAPPPAPFAPLATWPMPPGWPPPR